MSDVNWKAGSRVLVRACGRMGMMKLDPPVVGTIRRLLVRDESVWVELDARQREECHDFPAEDQRSRFVLTWPELCDSVVGKQTIR
jgi:hypothetical protein